MKKLYLKDIVQAIDGEIIRGPNNLIIDKAIKNLKETIIPNTLFFALDEKAQLNQDLLKKILVIVTDNHERFSQLEGINTLVRVTNIKKAIDKFAHYYRNLFSLPVIGITGTCGKTTTKEMVKHILGKHYKVKSTYLSSNGLSLNFHYLLGINSTTQAAVFEMGVAYPGDLLKSCEYFQPQIGVITTIGIDHLFGCKTLENYIKAKGELLKGLNYQGTLILNGDDENIKKIDLTPYQGQVIYFGTKPHCNFKAIDISYAQEGMNFTLEYQGTTLPNLFIPGYGEHNVYNALAAIAATVSTGLEIDINEAAETLKSFQPIGRHLQFYPGLNGSLVIDDTWNANPTSVEMALKVLRDIAEEKKKIVVLTEMQLLGNSATEYYSQIGTKVVDMGIDILITVGRRAKQISKQALEMGMKEVYICKKSGEALKVLKGILDNQSIVLVKMEDYFSRILRNIIVGDYKRGPIL